MRTLHINDKAIPLREDRVAKLIESGVLYECGPDDGHDLHINPESPIFLTGVEILSVAIAEGMADSMAEASAEAAAKVVQQIQPDGTILITTNGTTRVVPIDEPVFLLRGQDEIAAGIVRTWAASASAVGVAPEMVEEAQRVANAMDAWPKKKIADLPNGPTEFFANTPATVFAGDTPAAAATDEVKGLPVVGYKPTQSQGAIDMVNEGKQLEERVIRYVERVAKLYGPSGQGVDLMFARGNIEDGFSRVFKKVFQPDGSRIALPEDAEEPARNWRETTTGS